jgi:high-affinity iron transporter
MLQSFLILFRETLEVALVVGIVLGYLVKSDQRKLRPLVYGGLVAGVGASVAVALLFDRLAGGFSGRGEAIFEGVTMLAGAALLTTLIFWMARKSDVSGELEAKVRREMSRAGRIGLFLLVFVSVLREGVESVIFLGAARIASPEHNLVGALLGVAAAAALGLLLFRGALRIRLARFFAVMNVILILFAAGLVAHGIHELQEAGALPALVEQVWNLNPSYADGTGPIPLLHEDGAVGGILKGLFGYDGNPSLIELIGYGVYLAAAALLWLRVARKPDPDRAADYRTSAPDGSRVVG